MRVIAKWAMYVEFIVPNVIWSFNLIGMNYVKSADT